VRIPRKRVQYAPTARTKKPPRSTVPPAGALGDQIAVAGEKLKAPRPDGSETGESDAQRFFGGQG
jgi:hypothetical protein